MPNPQQPELADAPAGPVPIDNQPGHHPATEQDKPDLDAFAQRLGVVETPEAEEAEEQAGRRIAPPVIAAAVVGVLAAVLALLAVRRRRSRR